MPRIRGFDIITFSLVLGVGFYTGNKFFSPMIIEQLKKDGNLRKDIPVPEYDSEGNRIDIQREIQQAISENQSETLTGKVDQIPNVPVNQIPKEPIEKQ